MNKKRIGIIIALVLSLSLFTITALAAGNNLEGYELLKDVMENSKEMKGGSFDYHIAVVDNNDVVFESMGSMMSNEEDAYVSGTLSDGQLTKAFEMSKVDGIATFKDVENNLFYQIDETTFDAYREDNYDRYDHYDQDYDRKMTESEERLFDALVGDMKNKVSLTTLSGGNKEITFELKEDDIPLAVNLMLNIASENHREYDNEQRELSLQEISSIFPFFEGYDADNDGYDQLVSDLRVLGFKLDMTIDSDNQVTGLGFFLEIEGKDEAGAYHVLSIDATLICKEFTDLSITPITIDGELMIIDQEMVEQWDMEFNRY